MHNAFYLKYRPQNLAELIGQDSVKKSLLSSFANNKLSHAYLFVGPRGTGKTSTARILAKMVNCEDSSKAPCNKCAICLSITDGSNMDLIEIDAASNRGIEDMRSLRDKIKLAPTVCRKKIYIIDEVHMLTTEAFNALLKTLEEPPAHVLFVMATTESAKIPQTILSRVQRVDFKLASFAELLETLQKIIKTEKIDIDEEALDLLVKKSDGSFRDGVKLLDQLASIGEKITVKSIDNSGSFQTILGLIKDLNSSAAALMNINKQLENGTDSKSLILGLMDIFRSLVFIKNGVGEQLIKSDLTEDKYEELVKISDNFTNQTLIKNLDILQEALERLKFASIQSLPLELAIVEMCDDNSKFKIQNSKLEEKKEEVQQIEPILSEIPISSVSDSPDIQKLKEKWTFVLETIRPYNFSLEALLRSINITECTDKEVRLEVPYSFHQRILEAPKNRDLLESILSDILGRNMRIKVILGNRPARAEDVANIELAADDEIIRAAAEIFSSDTVN